VTAAYLVAAHVLAALAVTLCDVALAATALTLTALVLSLVRHWRLHISRTDPRAIVTVLEHRGEWEIVRRDGAVTSAQLHGESLLSYPLVILLFRIPDARLTRAVVLPLDSLSYEQHRRLRVRLTLLRRTMGKTGAVLGK
jgi:hypothetical protein